ncbi:hypothetical protein J2741_001636 [Methanolinea mesophila]|nr:hypothetical protein [Methanolinea mesophila]
MNDVRPERKKAKKRSLLKTVSALRRFLRILRRFDIRTDMCHGEALIFCTGAVGALPQVLLGFIQFIFSSAIETDILAGPNFLACRHLFGHLNHLTPL